MAVTFRDYYETLGVSRDATPEQIQAAFRKQARKHHPDVNKASDSEEKFKQINEAYEVLRDPEKRRRYDELGSNWRAGQEFVPPGSGRQSRAGYDTRTPDDFEGFGGDFSDFFASLFGGSRAPRSRGRDVEGEITISLEEAYRGALRTISLQGDGQEGKAREIEVHIPQGTRNSTTLRLTGQGQAGSEGPGDLFIRVRIAPHPLFHVEGRTLTTDVPVSPWEAALGANIPVPTLDGPIEVRLPAGTSSGKRLRLRGQGWPDRNGQRGDLFARIRIEVPHSLSERERRLFEDLRTVSTFDPRKPPHNEPPS